MKFQFSDKYLDKTKAIDEGIDLVFERNAWDDFGYKTVFEVYYPGPETRKPRYAGSISMADIDAADRYSDKELDDYENLTQAFSSGYNAYDDLKEKLGSKFDKLSENMVSLGTEEYYTQINKLINSNEVTFDRIELMKSMNDLAFSPALFKKFRYKKVISTSFLRGLTAGYVTGKLYRLSKGERETVPYKFMINYYDNEEDRLLKSYSFETSPEDIIPTNIHAIIGNNGTGKTRLLKDIARARLSKGKKIKSEFNSENNDIGVDFKLARSENEFSGLMFISFSPFDEFQDVFKSKNNNDNKMFNSKYIGIHSFEDNQQDNEYIDYKIWEQKFEESLNVIKKSGKKQLLFWLQMRYLDFVIEKCLPGLDSSELEKKDFEIILKEKLNDESYKDKIYKNLSREFNIMSSGEKIVVLGVASLVAYVEEKTLVLFDEPELYLHPPLVSNYIRIISEIMAEKNGLVILVTHSPIILQEVPNNCVYITSNAEIPTLTRPLRPTFGENISILTNGIFGLDIEKAGFYKFIEEFFERNKTNDVGKIEALYQLNKLGSEANFFLDLLYDSYFEEYSEDE